MPFIKKYKSVIIQVALGVIVVGAIIFIAISMSQSSVTPQRIEPTSTTGVAASNASNMGSGSIIVTSGYKVVTSDPVPSGAAIPDTVYPEDKVTITIYLDYLCPFCQQFEATHNLILEKWINTGKVNVEYHPVAMIDAYSSVAANAIACVVDKQPDLFWATNIALFNNQPVESDPLVKDVSKSMSLVKDSLTTAGVSQDVINCADSNTYTDWVYAFSKKPFDEPIDINKTSTLQYTPTILIDGVEARLQSFDDTSILDRAISDAVNAKKL